MTLRKEIIKEPKRRLLVKILYISFYKGFKRNSLLGLKLFDLAPDGIISQKPPRRNSVAQKIIGRYVQA